MLRFLEISAASQNLVRDLGMYEDFGFQPLQVNETWSHQYGVVGDGSFQIGLHGTPVENPTLTFVLPDLAQHLPVLQDCGIEFNFMHISEQCFHNAGFTDTAGHNIWLLEARTYSPTLPDEDRVNPLGEFCEIRLPARHANHEQWAALGIDAEQAYSTPIRLDENTQRPTIVYEAAIERLVMHGTRQGWPGFSVTKNNEGLIRTAHGFDFLVRDMTQGR